MLGVGRSGTKGNSTPGLELPPGLPVVGRIPLFEGIQGYKNRSRPVDGQHVKRSCLRNLATGALTLDELDMEFLDGEVRNQLSGDAASSAATLSSEDELLAETLSSFLPSRLPPMKIPGEGSLLVDQ
jgi:hypothetical protein